MKKIIMALVAVLGLTLAFPVAAAADEVEPAAPWTALDTAAGGVQQPSTHTTVIDPHTADVTWAAGEADSALGTSLETSNLGIEVAVGDVVTVDYELIDGADPALGSVRLFLYYTAMADTFNDAPDQFVPAVVGPLSGTLQIVTDTDGTIGSLGLVYDTSNGGVEGTVRFTNLTVNDTAVLFQALPEMCEWDDELLADDEKCVEPTPDPTPTVTETATPTQEPTTEPTATKTPREGVGKLPATGVPGWLALSMIGVGLVAIGVAATAFAQRRKQ